MSTLCASISLYARTHARTRNGHHTRAEETMGWSPSLQNDVHTRARTRAHTRTHMNDGDPTSGHTPHVLRDLSPNHRRLAPNDRYLCPNDRSPMPKRQVTHAQTIDTYAQTIGHPCPNDRSPMPKR